MTDEQPYVNDPTVRETYADTTRLTSFDGHVFHIEFALLRPQLVAENRSASVPVTAARLVLSPKAALQLQDQLNQMIANLERAGTVKRIAAGPPTPQ